VCPAVQVFPHVPQFEESTAVRVHLPPQSVRGALQAQAPLTHMRSLAHA
jgi:hypothetical protein